MHALGSPPVDAGLGGWSSYIPAAASAGKSDMALVVEAEKGDMLWEQADSWTAA